MAGLTHTHTKIDSFSVGNCGHVVYYSVIKCKLPPATASFKNYFLEYQEIYKS